jgi:hypothetical protein
MPPGQLIRSFVSDRPNQTGTGGGAPGSRRPAGRGAQNSMGDGYSELRLLNLKELVAHSPHDENVGVN